VVQVIRPELLARIDLVQASADELGAEPLSDLGLSDPEALVLHLVAALEGEDVRDLHLRKLAARGPTPPRNGSVVTR
jgi:hypothetical protein